MFPDTLFFLKTMSCTSLLKLSSSNCVLCCIIFTYFLLGILEDRYPYTWPTSASEFSVFLGNIFQVAVVGSGHKEAAFANSQLWWRSLRASAALGLEISEHCARSSSQQLVLLPLLCVKVTYLLSEYAWNTSCMCLDVCTSLG